MAHRHRRVGARPARLASRRGKRETIARPLIRAALAAGVLILLSACGGDGSKDRLSAEEFRGQANAICAEFDEKISALETPSSPEAIPGYVEEVIPVVEEGLAELRALNPPEEFEEDYETMLDETEKSIPAARALSEAAAEEDAAAVQDAIAQGQRANEASNRVADELGLDECGQGE
jgi:hypothetical protein